MHEVSVVSNMVDAILKELENYDVEKVEEVNVLIGDLTSLGAEQLEFAYEIVTRGTLCTFLGQTGLRTSAYPAFTRFMNQSKWNAGTSVRLLTLTIMCIYRYINITRFP